VAESYAHGLTALTGMTTMAGQSGLNALATVVYPVQIHTTGTGWSSGIGRVLALTAPFVGGSMVRSGLSFLGSPAVSRCLCS
jgi:hypothetical protein